MIRQYTSADSEQVARMVQAGMAGWTKKKIIGMIQSQQAYVFASGGIKGCAVIGKPRLAQGQRTVDVSLFTALDHRRQGIGAALWDVCLAGVEQANCQRVETSYRHDTGDAAAFFRRRGFHRWFGMRDLAYIGPKFPSPKLAVEQYSPRFFAAYVALINECFFSLRKANNIKPFAPYAPGTYKEEELRAELAEASGNLFLFYHHSDFVGIGEVEDRVKDDGNAISTVAVWPAYRRRGYGHAITRFCANHLLDQGVSPVYIAVLENNEPARRLYRKLGFVPVASYEEAVLTVT